MYHKLWRFAVLTGVLGLAVFAALFISGAASPDMLFQILAPTGMLLSFLSCGLFAAAWITSITRAVKTKNYLFAAALLVGGLILIFPDVLRILRS